MRLEFIGTSLIFGMISKHNHVKNSLVIVYKINKNADLMYDIWPQIQENDEMCLSPLRSFVILGKNLMY